MSVRAALLFAFAWASRAVAAPLPPADAAPAPVPVRVERVKPRRETLPTLRFLRTNRDFLRSRLDGLRESPLAADGAAEPLDPRFLAYRALVQDALSASDSLGARADDRERRRLLSTMADLARLEAELDQFDSVLRGQRTRLGALQADFTVRQRTALAIVVSGYPDGAGVDTVAVRLDDGSSHAVALGAAEREALAHGGVLELFHGLVEPREQLVQVSLAGASLAADSPGWLSLDPVRDRLTFVRLDLSAVRPAGGAPGISATSWLNDDSWTARGEEPARP